MIESLTEFFFEHAIGSFVPDSDLAALFWVGLTLAIYSVFSLFRSRMQETLWLQPLLWGAGVIILILIVGDIDVYTYLDKTSWIVVLLAPATIAIAVPIYDNLRIIRDAVWAFVVALCAGSVVAVGSAVLFGWLFGLKKTYLISLLTKSITSPIAMGVAQELGGLPALAMGIVIVTGNIGVIVSPWLFRRLKLTDPRAQGLALGVAAHGIGTAEALRQSALIGSFAGLSMGVNGVVSAVLLPLFF